MNMIKVHHLRTIQQQERLISQPALTHRLPHLLRRVRRIRHRCISVPQSAPVARLSGRGEIALAKRADVVVGNALSGLGVLQEMLHLPREVRKVAFDLDVVLLRTRRDEQVVVVLNILQFVGDNNGVAGLTVFQGCRIGASCSS